MADQLTLSRPGGGTLSPPSTTRPPRFSDLATCLPATTTAQLVYTPNRGNAVQIPIVTIDDDIDQVIQNSHMSQVLEDMGLPTVAPATAVLATAAPETAGTVSRETVQEYIDSYDNMLALRYGRRSHPIVNIDSLNAPAGALAAPLPATDAPATAVPATATPATAAPATVAHISETPVPLDSENPSFAYDYMLASLDISMESNLNALAAPATSAPAVSTPATAALVTVAPAQSRSSRTAHSAISPATAAPAQSRSSRTAHSAISPATVATAQSRLSRTAHSAISPVTAAPAQSRSSRTAPSAISPDAPAKVTPTHSKSSRTVPEVQPIRCVLCCGCAARERQCQHRVIAFCDKCNEEHKCHDKHNCSESTTVDQVNIGPSRPSLNGSLKDIQAKMRLNNRRYQEADLVRLNGRGSVRDMPRPQELSTREISCPQGSSAREIGPMILESKQIRQEADRVLGRSSHRHSRGHCSNRDMPRPHHGSNRDMPRPRHGSTRKAPRPSPYRHEERPSSRRPSNCR